MKELPFEVWTLNALKRIYQRKGFANPHSCWSQANTTVIMWSIQLTLCGCRSIRYNTVLCHILLLSTPPDYQKGPEPKATSLHISSSYRYTISSAGLPRFGQYGFWILLHNLHTLLAPLCWAILLIPLNRLDTTGRTANWRLHDTKQTKGVWFTSTRMGHTSRKGRRSRTFN